MRIALATSAVSISLFLWGDPALGQTLSERLKGESAQTLAAAAREKGSAVRGAILFTRPEPGCTKCHVAGSNDLLGPDLNQFGPEATDQYLVEALLEPSKVIRKGFESATVTTTAGRSLSGRIIEQSDEKLVLRDASQSRQLITLSRDQIDEIVPSETSSMPANLVDQLKDHAEFLDLVRYMFELKAASRIRPQHVHVRGGAEVSPELQGMVLLKDCNCVACHKDDSGLNPVSVKQAPILSWASGRIDPHYLEKFIADPLRVKPNTTMPDVMTGLTAKQRKQAATELTHYIVSLGNRPFTRQAINSEAAERGREVFHSVGCVACHSPRNDTAQELLPDSSVPLGSLETKYNLDGLAEFLKNPHEVRPSGRMPNMQLTHWEAVDVSNYLLRSKESAEKADVPFQLDSTLVASGKRRFDQLGCVKCHGNTTEETRLSLPLSRMKTDQGCLSDESGAWPRFSLKNQQCQAIQAALSRKPQRFSDEEHVSLTLTAFRCLNCHQRDELGGVSPDRDFHFQTTDPNLGPQGRIPPPLTDVGAKLNADWMRQVLVSGRSIRPYMKTRMPQYGADNVAHLVDLFEGVDHLPAIKYGAFSDQKEIRKIGAEMVGTGGLNCIACHTFQLKQAANMPAVDLTEMAERLKKDWFYHYMRDPQRLSMNTVMPSFWPGGQAIRKDVLGGDTDQQLEALWQYLLDGRQAQTPRGLIHEPLELLATDEAVILRRSYPGIGKRGIGVGYPNQVNIAFDAEQMRLGIIWKGKFADPGGVWRNQGNGTVRPLGHSLIHFPKGPELDDAESPWIVDDGRPPQHQFKGYSLDEKQRPKFLYQFSDVTVEDYPVDVLDSSTKEPRIRRTLTLKSSGSRRQAIFRAAEGKSIQSEGKGVFLIDKSLRIHVDDHHKGEIVDVPSGKQLRVPIPISTSGTTLTLDYIW